MSFTIQKEDQHTQARLATLTTAHGTIKTPIFMPIGTQGSVKAVHQRELTQDLRTEIILANTYHLYLRPGMQTLDKAGGLHPFMHWEHPILTDSGGYQVYSLAKSRKITEEGVTFRSPLDGSKHLFTPENVMEMERTIGADIIMAFDECTSYPCSYAYAKASMAMTHRWLKRCQEHLLKVPARHPQLLFAIVQGSIYKDLRQESAHTIAEAATPGNAIGGVCHPTGQLYEVTGWVCDILPKTKPRYLMGVGTPKDILTSIALGVDMFDCVLPTRNARNGCLFTTQGIINIKNQRFKEDFSQIDPGLHNYASNYHTKAYLHHLIQTRSYLGAQIATLHNLAFYRWLIEEARAHIAAGDFHIWYPQIIPTLMRKYKDQYNWPKLLNALLRLTT